MGSDEGEEKYENPGGKRIKEGGEEVKRRKEQERRTRAKKHEKPWN